MKVMPTKLDGVIIIAPQVFRDDRGFFMESYSRRDFEQLGIDVEFVQDNHSLSRRGTLRGLHFQREYPQAKLLRVLRGRAFDVAIDLRADSPTCGRWHGVILDADSKRMFYIPVGFAHGFLALTDEVELAYKCSEYYHPEDEGGLIWNDPEVGIDWPLDLVDRPLLSTKDGQFPTLSELTFRYRLR